MRSRELTTHVLDLACGGGAPGLAIDCYRLNADGAWQLLAATTTDEDGRNRSSLAGGNGLRQGTYQLEFHVAEYYGTRGIATTNVFFDTVPVRLVVTERDEHHHVPLLLAPWGYTAYRGN